MYSQNLTVFKSYEKVVWAIKVLINYFKKKQLAQTQSLLSMDEFGGLYEPICNLRKWGYLLSTAIVIFIFFIFQDIHHTTVILVSLNWY